MSRKSILFDLDNTLTDRRRSISVYAESFIRSFPDVTQIWTIDRLAESIALADNGGYAPEGSSHDSVCLNIASYLKNELHHYLPQPQKAIEQHWKDNFPQCSVEMEGATSLLKTLADEGYVIGVVSNGRQESRVKTVEALPFYDEIEFVLSSGLAGVKKPSSEIFLSATKMAKSSPDNSWFVGDHPKNDVLGAEAAGLRAIWLSGFHAWPKELPSPRRSVNSLCEIGEYFGLPNSDCFNS